eukprot:gnl/Trimastix_PCT/652.p1 GENE.gnl/Trimastix_PCT/652~~gnl/Trimastix_PCT/652.p1  ORF type:complete len:262 (+),score=62.16 gnl/Trimastix_PCT/652:32-817(+)
MGRRRRKPLKPFCWYCDRTFDDEKVLIQHQKAKHFKCQWCNKKMSTAAGLVIHALQVHKENITKVPNANPGHDSVELEIYGMEGVPEHDLQMYRERQESGRKKSRTEPTNAFGAFPPIPGQFPPPFFPGPPGPYPNAPMVPPPVLPPAPGMRPPPPFPPGLPGPGMPPPPNPGPAPQPSGPPQGVYNAPPPAAEPSAAPTPMHTQHPLNLVYSDEMVQMEEARAEAERYRYDEEKVKEQVDLLGQSIEARLSGLTEIMRRT